MMMSSQQQDQWRRPSTPKQDYDTPHDAIDLVIILPDTTKTSAVVGARWVIMGDVSIYVTSLA